MKTTDPRYQDYVKIIFTISDISDNADDNDPALKNSLEAKFDKEFNEFKLSFARKVVMRTKVTENIAKGKGTNEDLDENGMIELQQEAQKRSFTTSEIASLKIDFIDERLNLLAKVPLNEFEILDRRRIRRLQAFLGEKKAVNSPLPDKADKTFIQFFINIPDDKKDIFASMLRDEFKTEIGLGIRYMIEALKKLNLIAIGDRERSSLFRSIERYFQRDIGDRRAVFPAKSVIICKDNVETAVDRINPLLLKVQPPK